MVDLAEKLKNLPDSSGVYIMLDNGGNIIYIGKAKVLKNRVRQYFHQSGNKTEKVMRMVEKIADFRYIITSSEKDALSLESTLIKKHKPYYNILLKDDKSYPYIKVDMSSNFPSFSVTRKVKKDKNKYFGPLMSGVHYKDILEILSCSFKVRLCALNLDKVPKKHKPCLIYHIDRCYAPCKQLIEQADYLKNVNEAISFLQGNHEKAIDILTKKMTNASIAEDYETALIYRDRLKMLDAMKQKTLSAVGRDINLDAFKFVSDDAYGVMSIIIIRGGKIVGGENYPITKLHLMDTEIYSEFIMQYYESDKLIPSEIILGTEQEFSLSEPLTEKAGYKVHVTVPKQGFRQQLLDMTEKNAADFLEKSRDSERKKQDMTIGAVALLKEHLKLQTLPYRMECYDISNISGTNKVASMVVFLGGESTPSEYRRFKIKTVEGSNDFASMKEVLSRRLGNLTDGTTDSSLSTKPDLIVVDGGKGQLSSALEAMNEQGQNIQLISLAKREEEVFMPHMPQSILIPRSSVALKLLQRIRDEAHRFAITYHRSLRGSKMLLSTLDGIDGVGKKRRVELIKHFGSLLKLKDADIDEIATVSRIGIALATKIKERLNKDEIQDISQ